MFQFFHILLNTCYFLRLVFDSNHFHGCEVVSHCGFDFFLVEVQLIYNVVSVSDVYQSDSDIIYM